MRTERPSHPTPVEDYTNAFLATFGVIVFMVLFAIWAIWGLIVAGVISWVADRLMTLGAGHRRSS